MHDKFYSTQNWKRIRSAQLARQPICEACGAPADVADHITRIKAGGAKRYCGNLQSLCTPCHNAKRQAEGQGKRWLLPKHRGCDEHGVPRDPDHPWAGSITTT